MTTLLVEPQLTPAPGPNRYFLVNSAGEKVAEQVAVPMRHVEVVKEIVRALDADELTVTVNFD